MNDRGVQPTLCLDDAISDQMSHCIRTMVICAKVSDAFVIGQRHFDYGCMIASYTILYLLLSDGVVALGSLKDLSTMLFKHAVVFFCLLAGHPTP